MLFRSVLVLCLAVCAVSAASVQVRTKYDTVLRQAPGEIFPPVKSLAKGTTLTVTANEYGWLRTVGGYINVQHVTHTDGTAVLPEAPPLKVQWSTTPVALHVAGMDTSPEDFVKPTPTPTPTPTPKPTPTASVPSESCCGASNCCGLSAASPTPPASPSRSGSSVASSYNPAKAVDYAIKYWCKPNHDCGSYSSCGSKYDYYGSEACGYSTHGGDCANFVSQCLINAGHPALKWSKGGEQVCRSFCGGAEPGAGRLWECLSKGFGWVSSGCNKYSDAGPPSGVKPGDVVIFRSGSCGTYPMHSAIVTKVDNGVPYVSSHSPAASCAKVDFYTDGRPYVEFLHY